MLEENAVPSDGKGFVSYMRPSTSNDEVAARTGRKACIIIAQDEFHCYALVRLSVNWQHYD